MKPFYLAQGNEAPHLEGIHPCYDVVKRLRPSNGKPYYSFMANVSIENLLPMLTAFCRQLDEPGFFLCELPASQQEEERLRQSEEDPFHCDVFYKDGCSNEELLRLLSLYGKWFIADGMSCFGFSSHKTKDEIYVGPYKIVYVYTDDFDRYRTFLETCGLPYEPDMKTVWDNFTEDEPGQCTLVTLEGKTVYDIVETLRKDGLYFSEHRER